MLALRNVEGISILSAREAIGIAVKPTADDDA